MQVVFWTIAVVVAMLAIGGVIARLSHGDAQLSRPLRIAPASVGTKQRSPEPSNFQVHDRVFHDEFGHGTIVDIDGHKLTIQFDEGGAKRVLDSFITKSSNSSPPQ